MIITRTPYRVSLFGGGSDYPKWYLEHSGAVLGMAIDKYCYISVRRLPPFFEHKHRVVYSRIESVSDVTQIEHPSVRAVMQETKVEEGLEIHHDGDLPARSGLGSSSSFTVGLLNAIHALRGQMTTKQFLATEAIRIEQNVIGENVGSQDQIFAAYGGFNCIDFHTNGSFSVCPVIIPKERQQHLLDRMMLFFTGVSRYSSEVAKHKIANLEKKSKNIEKMRSMVDEAKEILTTPSRNINQIGELLHESWRLKRDLAPEVSTSVVDDIYQAGRDAGAIGGKILGAGGGGFILFFVEPEKQQSVRARLNKLIEVNFDIDLSGSNVVLYRPTGLHRP